MYLILTFHVILANILKLSHAIENLEIKTFYNNNNEILEDLRANDHRRVVRHTNIETVTDNLLSHILRVIKQKYPNLKKTHDTAKKSMHSIKAKLRRYIKKKKMGSTKSHINVKYNKKIVTN